MSGEVVIETREGARYGVSSVGKARALYPGCRIVGYADGRVFEEKTPGKSRRSALATSDVGAGRDSEHGGRASDGDGRDTVAAEAGTNEDAE